MPTTADLKISKDREQELSREAGKYTPTDEEARRVSSIKHKVEEKRTTKLAYEKTWFVNGSFIRGYHYVSFNDATKTFEIPYRVPQHRVRLTINYILAYFRRTRARLTAHKPGLFARPATTDQEDVERARLGAKVLDSELYRMDFHAKHKQFAGWMLECGSDLFCLRWNPWIGPLLYEDKPVTDEYGQPVADPETGQPSTERVPMTDEQGRQLHEGANELEVLSPYEIEIDPNATSLDDAEWLIRSRLRTLDWIRENYPEKGKFVEREDVRMHSFYEKRIRQMVGIFGYTTDAETVNSTDDSMGPAAAVHEYWERPSQKHPKGRLIVVAGNVELWNGDNPYNHKMLPFAKADEIVVSGRFWGQAVIEHLIPLQKNLNRARSQEVENRTLMGRPKWLVPRTAKVRQASFDAEAGEKVDYSVGPRGERPEIIHPPPTHLSTQVEIQHTVTDFQEVASFHEVSRGILPSANLPAEGIMRLQQADDTAMGDTAANIDGAITRLGRMILMNCEQFWTEERLVRAGGEISRVEAVRVRGEDLRGRDVSADYFDVRVVPGSTLLRDPEEQRKSVQHMIDIGLLNPLVHRDLILKMLDRAEIEEAYEDDRLDEQWAARENELMEQGIQNIPRDFENHQIHLKVLDRFRKTERYRRLPPHIQKLFDEHAREHVQQALMVGQQQMANQAMLQQVGGAGRPGGEPGAPPPAEEPPSQPE